MGFRHDRKFLAVLLASFGDDQTQRLDKSDNYLNVIFSTLLGTVPCSASL